MRPFNVGHEILRGRVAAVAVGNGASEPRPSSLGSRSSLYLGRRRRNWRTPRMHATCSRSAVHFRRAPNLRRGVLLSAGSQSASALPAATAARPAHRRCRLPWSCGPGRALDEPSLLLHGHVRTRRGHSEGKKSGTGRQQKEDVERGAA